MNTEQVLGVIIIVLIFMSMYMLSLIIKKNKAISSLYDINLSMVSLILALEKSQEEAKEESSELTEEDFENAKKLHLYNMTNGSNNKNEA